MNGSVSSCRGGKLSIRSATERVVVCDTNYSSVRVRNLQEYSDPPTLYEQEMKFMGGLRKYSPMKDFRGRHLTVAVTDKEYLKPRLDPTKLIELEKNLVRREQKGNEDDFYLMGKDEFGRVGVKDFDEKMLAMRRKGFSPGKHIHKPFHKFGQPPSSKKKTEVSGFTEESVHHHGGGLEEEEKEAVEVRDILLGGSRVGGVREPESASKAQDVNREFALSLGGEDDLEDGGEAGARSKLARRRLGRGEEEEEKRVPVAEDDGRTREDEDMFSQQLEALVAMVDIGKSMAADN